MRQTSFSPSKTPLVRSTYPIDLQFGTILAYPSDTSDSRPLKTVPETDEDMLDLLPEPPKNAAKAAPAAKMSIGLSLVQCITNDFSAPVGATPAQVRNLVMNRLILETDNPNPNIRMRALELLGKVRDVGLFSERSEMTVTHQTTAELREKLMAKLQKLRITGGRQPQTIEDAQIVEDEVEDALLSVLVGSVEPVSAALPWVGR